MTSTFSTRSAPGAIWTEKIEQFADRLTDLFGRKVDLVSLRSLHPLLQPSVLAEARLVFAACEIVALACDLLAWMQMLALIGEARRWEPKNGCGSSPVPGRSSAAAAA